MTAAWTFSQQVNSPGRGRPGIPCLLGGKRCQATACGSFALQFSLQPLRWLRGLERVCTALTCDYHDAGHETPKEPFYAKAACVLSLSLSLVDYSLAWLNTMATR
jgi:hypothetical protein